MYLALLQERDPTTFAIIDAARLAHGKGMAAYLGMMAQRLVEMRRVLKPAGNVYLHCDQTAGHYLKMLMDATFGRRNFRNEIVWSYQRWTGATKHFQRMHDVVLFYAASNVATFNLLTENYSVKSKHKAARRSKSRDGILEQEYTGDTSRQKAMRDVWEISYLNSQAKERTGYPTQKPLALLDRIIRASSNEGDVVFDPFCGCATAAVSAERLQRQWIGVDISAKAAELVTIRLSDILDQVPLYKAGDVIHRTDQPGRTDLGTIPPYRSYLDLLYGRQDGLCGGCGEHFRKRNLTVDHIVPSAHGGTDLLENLWLLCGACNSSKGTRSQEQFLKERMQKRAALFPWLVS